ncbi:unnamed protein product [Calypogeia fissa]
MVPLCFVACLVPLGVLGLAIPLHWWTSAETVLLTMCQSGMTDTEKLWTVMNLIGIRSLCSCGENLINIVVVKLC